ncbi:MAG: 23S rRNA (adenine(2503)-C(2))-methyltransferase RlmN [Verrucomicrobia bacterium]|nr:23S rRNA (adenine(2503)-C(2))-methyltransferase RlmN [Verrucomicrobiota bacterium]
MLSIFRCTQKEYAEALVKQLGRGSRHAALVYSELFRKGEILGVTPAFKTAKKLLEEIKSATVFELPQAIRHIEEGKTRKFLLGEVEAVAIPMAAGWTLCVSSQVGCRMGCAFCQTGKMGLLRNLTAEEIVAQVFYAVHVAKIPIRNLVFMGMGEPFDNYEEVMRTIRVLTDPGGFGFGPRHISVSTSGRVEEILRFAQEADPALNLAVSVNAPNDAVRARLMPINDTYSMQDLKQALEVYLQHPRRTLLAEYVLIKDVNDSLQAAEELAAYLQGLRVKINVIPYNPGTRGIFAPPHLAQQEAFVERLRALGFRVLLRSTHGQKIMAACGQLGDLELRKQYRLKHLAANTPIHVR